MARTKQCQRKVKSAADHSRKDINSKEAKGDGQNGKDLNPVTVEPSRAFRVRFNNANRASLEEAHPEKVPNEINAILTQMWMDSNERKEAFNATPEEIRAVRAENAAVAKNAPRKAFDPKVEGDPSHVFRVRYCAINRAAVEAANSKATHREIDDILKQMWINSKERQDAFKATFDEIEAVRAEYCPRKPAEQRFQIHLRSKFFAKHRAAIVEGNPGADKKRITEILEQMWNDSDEKKWGSHKSDVGTALDIEASDESNSD